MPSTDTNRPPGDAWSISAHLTNPYSIASESPLKHLALMIPPLTNIWQGFSIRMVMTTLTTCSGLIEHQYYYGHKLPEY